MLENLYIYSAHQDNSGMDISGLKNLKHFTISLNFGSRKRYSFQDKDLACLSQLTKLNNLSIGSPGIGNEGLKYLSGLTNLIYLSIGDSKITDDGVKSIGNLQKISSLNISGNNLTDKCLVNFYGMKNLNRLEIRTSKTFSQPAVANLRQNLPGLEQVNIQKPPPIPPAIKRQ